jgi:hypothetical protein
MEKNVGERRKIKNKIEEQYTISEKGINSRL